MIDICFSCTVGDSLFESSELIQSDGVFPLNLHLNYGHLDCNIFEEQAKRNVNTIKYTVKTITEEELQEAYTEEVTDINNKINDIEKFLVNGHAIRLWLSNTASDRCGLYWFSHFAKDYSNDISIVLCPGYEYIPYLRTAHIQPDWALFSAPDFVAQFASTAKILDEHEKSAYAEAWPLLVKQNSPLRILIDNTIVGVDETFFDSIILSFVKPEPQSQKTVMGKMLGKWQGGCDAAFISMRIEHFINKGNIKVHEEIVDKNDCYWERTIALIEN